MVVAPIRTSLSINLYGITPNQSTISPACRIFTICTFFRKLRWRKFTDGVVMPEILQIFHQPPASHLQLHSRVQGGVVNVESQLNCSFESDFGSRGSFDDTENFQCCEFAGSCFTEFSNSSVDELSKVTAFIEQNQSFRKRKHESVDSDSGLIGSPKAKKNVHNEDSKAEVNMKPDYVHVRARHGEATDRHSLAERARREKIKKKMQYLQDLVPGCNKLTNKAAILDEIITYVQCLQRHVEFLTMKLAASTTTVDFNMDISLPEEQEIEVSRQQ